METYMEHIELLKEWNEENSFFPTSTSVLMTEIGVQVVQDVQVRQIEEVFEDGTKRLSAEYTWIQVWAIYGDDDQVCRLVVASNGHEPRGPQTEVLVNSLIRG